MTIGDQIKNEREPDDRDQDDDEMIEMGRMPPSHFQFQKYPNP